MPNRVVYTFIASDKFSALANKMAASTGNLSAQMAHLKDEAAIASGAIQRVNSKIRNLGFGLIATGAAFGAAQVPFLKRFAELEKIQIAFEQVIGSVEKGRAVFQDLQEFQKGPPFDLLEIKTAAQTLLVFGTATEDLRLELTALGNISAASGARIEDLANVFGKVQTSGRVTQDVINQFALRGVNVLEVWAEKSGASMDKVRDAVSKGQIPFSVLRETILDLGAREGGRFTGIMTEQSKRLAGAWTRFGSAVDLARAKLGGILSEAGDVPQFLNTLAAMVSKVTKAIVAWTERHPLLTKFIANLGTTLFVLGAIVLAFSAILSTLAVTMLPILILRFIGFRAVISLVVFALPGLSLLLKGVVFLFGSLASMTLLSLAALLLIPLAIGLIIFNFREIKLFFQFLIEDLKELGGVVIDKVMQPIQLFFAQLLPVFGFVATAISAIRGGAGGIGAQLSGMVDSAKGLLGTEGAQVNARGEIVARSASTIDMTINAPRGVVGGVTAQTKGGGSFSLGLNNPATSGAAA